MSWSFSALGKPQAVAAKARKEAEKPYCQEPEESFRKTALGLIAASAESYQPDIVVQVEASGSQNKNGDDVLSNQLSLSIKPLTYFLDYTAGE